MAAAVAALAATSQFLRIDSKVLAQGAVTGFCCIQTGQECIETTRQACAAEQGTYVANMGYEGKADCDYNLCDAPGMCCTPGAAGNGSCEAMSKTACQQTTGSDFQENATAAHCQVSARRNCAKWRSVLRPQPAARPANAPAQQANPPAAAANPDVQCCFRSLRSCQSLSIADCRQRGGVTTRFNAFACNVFANMGCRMPNINIMNPFGRQHRRRLR